jgi:CubicO group peptidase (beta-lactamase class C family)
MSAAVVKDQKVLWARGFGYADPEKKIPATEHTPYHLASLTKTFASTVVMRLMLEGKVSLDDPVSKYDINLESAGVIRLKHLLSHTSEGHLGEHDSYAGATLRKLNDAGLLGQVDETRARVFIAEKKYAEANRVITRAVQTLELGGESALLADALTVQGVARARLDAHENSLDMEFV